MSKIKKIPVIVTIACFLFVLGRYTTEAEGDIPLKETIVARGIRYMSGGIGVDERAELKEREHEYNLKIIFATTSGAYVSHVRTVIYGERGLKLIEAVSEGPWFYARLPEGYYKIEVFYRQHKMVREAWVGSGLKRLMFHWDYRPQ